MKYAGLGSVSHGTLLDEDLLARFADELEYQCNRNKRTRGIGLREKRELIRDARALAADENRPCILTSLRLEALFDALDEFAAPYCCFGAAEGDGAEFGYWADIGALERAVRDGEVEKIAAGDDYSWHRGDLMIVNDHGNVTFGYVDGRGRFHETWSCV